MGEDSLIGGSIWDEYPRKVQDRMNNPQHMGGSSEEDAKARNAKLTVADLGAGSCGDAVRLLWLVDEKTDKIIDAKLKSFGCGAAIASSDTMVDLCTRKAVDEAVKITNLDVEFATRDSLETPAIPSQKMHCSVTAYNVIKQAAAHYKGISPEDFKDQIIACGCVRVSLGTIKEVTKLNDLHTVEEVTQYTKTGVFCKSCIRPGGHEKRDYYLIDILAETKAEIDREKLKNTMKSDVAFDEITVVGQLKAVESVLSAEIRPMLHNDGGDSEVVDIQKAKGVAIDVYTRHLGACSGYSSGSGITLYAIETVLQEELSLNIRVMPV